MEEGFSALGGVPSSSIVDHEAELKVCGVGYVDYRGKWPPMVFIGFFFFVNSLSGEI